MFKKTKMCYMWLWCAYKFVSRIHIYPRFIDHGQHVIFQSVNFHPCNFVRHFPVLHYSLLRSRPIDSPSFSTPATSSVICQSCIFQSCKFSSPGLRREGCLERPTTQLNSTLSWVVSFCTGLRTINIAELQIQNTHELCHFCTVGCFMLHAQTVPSTCNHIRNTRPVSPTGWPKKLVQFVCTP